MPCIGSCDLQATWLSVVQLFGADTTLMPATNRVTLQQNQAPLVMNSLALQPQQCLPAHGF